MLSSAGIVPVSELEPKLSFSSDVSNPSSAGIVPVNELEVRNLRRTQTVIQSTKNTLC